EPVVGIRHIGHPVGEGHDVADGAAGEQHERGVARGRSRVLGVAVADDVEVTAAAAVHRRDLSLEAGGECAGVSELRPGRRGDALPEDRSEPDEGLSLGLGHGVEISHRAGRGPVDLDDLLWGERDAHCSSLLSGLTGGTTRLPAGLPALLALPTDALPAGLDSGVPLGFEVRRPVAFLPSLRLVGGESVGGNHDLPTRLGVVDRDHASVGVCRRWLRSLSRARPPAVCWAVAFVSKAGETSAHALKCRTSRSSKRSTNASATFWRLSYIAG